MINHLPVFQKAWAKIADSSSRTTLNKILQALTLLLIPTQLALHFWPLSSLVYGVRISYLSPALAVLDLLILASLATSRTSTRKHWFMQDLLPLFLINLVISSNPLSTLAWSLHALLFISFIETLTPNFHRKTLVALVCLGIFSQVALGALQVLLGHTLQGPMYYLGERAVSLGQPNVATGSLLGAVALRAYGTFNHPNILAGWLVVAFLIVIPRWKHDSRRHWLCGLVVMLGIILTQSRAGLVTFLLFALPWTLVSPRAWKLYYLGAAGTTLLLFHFLGPSLARSEFSLAERRSLQQTSKAIIKAQPLFGTGMNASISSYPQTDPSQRLLQPDHNSATLLLSWVGVAGLLALVLLPNFFSSLYNLTPLTPLFFFDHYLVTSTQGLLILLIYLGSVSMKYEF